MKKVHVSLWNFASALVFHAIYTQLYHMKIMNSPLHDSSLNFNYVFPFLTAFNFSFFLAALLSLRLVRPSSGGSVKAARIMSQLSTETPMNGHCLYCFGSCITSGVLCIVLGSGWGSFSLPHTLAQPVLRGRGRGVRKGMVN